MGTLIMPDMRINNLLIIVFTFLVLHGSPVKGYSDPEDDTTQILLLEDINIQIDATYAINDLYNFKFARAEMQFRWLRQKYPDHPISFFLLGLSEWWKIAVNVENEEFDESFMMQIDSAIFYARKLYKQPQWKIEAAFFLAAGYGFKGRLYAERRAWRKAATAGKNALKYLQDCKGKPYLSPELMFGDGIYNYFSVWIPENYPILKPVVALFPKGDQEAGLKQLRTVATNAFYTRTEAQFWMMRILANEENDKAGALQISEYLHKTYPDNAYFHRYYTRLLYATGQLKQTEALSLEILTRIDSGYTGYEAMSGRYA
ncbi:tol-pal system protein YbgF, partial [Bacteroidota bacterium]